MLNYDLELSGKLVKGKHTYRMIVETEFPDLVRIEDDGFNDNEIGVPRSKVSVKEEQLTVKDTLVTIDSGSHNEDKVQLSSQSSRFYHDTVRTLHKIKECSEQLQEMISVMSLIVKKYQLRSDLVKPFEVVCKKFKVWYDEEYPLMNKSKKRSKSYQRHSKVLTDSNSNTYRQSRLSTQLNLMKGATSNFQMMMKTMKVTKMQVRDLASFGGFEQVEKLVK